MIRVYGRTQPNARYFTQDRAEELDGIRSGPAGRWLRGTGPLDSEAISNVFASTLRSATVGYDLVIAAPRPLSILLAIDERHAPAVVAAHQRAVGGAVTYLEHRGLVVRERRFGEDYEEPAQWRRIAAFTHGVNRHGEPHLHDHVLVGAQTLGATSALDHRSLRVHALTADALYRAHLRDEIGRTTPWQPWRSFTGAELVRGLDEGYRALWGGHFEDRPAKQHWTREEVRAKWASDVERFEPLTEIDMPELSREGFNHHAFQAALSTKTSIYRRDIVAAFSEARPLGVSGIDVARIVDEQYPELRDSRGLREPVVTPRRALSLDRVLKLDRTRMIVGPSVGEAYRSREESSARDGRSR